MVPGQVLVLEPRRLAARMAARRIAQESGESLGETVGYQVRFEDVAGPRTRLRFLTEGILTRRLGLGPGTAGVDWWCWTSFTSGIWKPIWRWRCCGGLQSTRAPGSRLVVMSATLEAGPVARYLEHARCCVRKAGYSRSAYASALLRCALEDAGRGRGARTARRKTSGATFWSFCPEPPRSAAPRASARRWPRGTGCWFCRCTAIFRRPSRIAPFARVAAQS